MKMPPRAAERALIAGYVRAERRAGFRAVLALDDTFAGIMRTTRQPIVGQMRLTWWHEALMALGATTPPGQPVLAAVAQHVLPCGVAAASLAAMIDGWEVLLGADALGESAWRVHAAERGGGVFAALATVLDDADFIGIRPGGEGWALADLSRHLSDPMEAAAVRLLARARLAAALRYRWPVRLRPIGMLAHLAAADIAMPPALAGSPRRLGRMLMHRIWGR